MAGAGTYTTFIQALNVMNASLEANRESLVFKPLLKACETNLRDTNLGIAVYKDDPDTPHDYFTIRMKSGTFVLVSRGKQEPNVAWKVSESYLTDVAHNPRKYVDSPTMLSFDWLKDRVGLTV